MFGSWSCEPNSTQWQFTTGRQAQKEIQFLRSAAKGATHIVFNIGNHHTNMGRERFQTALQHYATALDHTQAKLIVRSQTTQHFWSTDQKGEFNLTLLKMWKAGQLSLPNNWSSYCTSHPPRDALSFLEVELRQFAKRRDAQYLDVLGVSDDPGAHPNFHGEKAIYDCLHFCQNCDTLGAMNSMLLPLLAQPSVRGRPILLQPKLSVSHPA